jgi:mono/diheme cytochrome c family protein
MRYWLAAIAIIIAIAVLATASWIRRGFSARDQPSVLEQFVARSVRRLAIPANASATTNPVPLTKEMLADARAHFANHCAICHANDGSGNAEIGRNLYPKPPDMRSLKTQELTDGELFYIIENGVRLTGMPAWGRRHEGTTDSWKLVHFIRHLKELTPAEIREMERLNPKGPDERQGSEPSHSHTY